MKNRSNGSDCPFCSGNQVLKGVNDLESCHPEVAEEWSEKNHPMMPADFTSRANKKVWWRCGTCGYEWQARIADRTEGHGCPMCKAMRKLAFYFPEEHTAIEFTDTRENRGPKRRWEEAKNWLCVNASIRMIRIVAPGAIGYKNYECVQRPNNGQIEAFDVVKRVMESI